MKTLASVILAVVAVVAILLFLRSRVVTPVALQVQHIPIVAMQLKAQGLEKSWAVIVFVPAGEAPNNENVVNLQYSIEDGHLGLDWVLRAPRNISDKEKFSEFARSRGHIVTEHEGNGVRYLRIEGPKVAYLGAQVAQEFYGLSSDAEINLIAEKFQWEP